MSKRVIKLTVEYDGTDLCGWQRQANAPSVQAHIESALSKLFNRPTQIVGASRTDAGVHAIGQVASVHTESSIPVQGITRGLNSLLPPSIAVRSAKNESADFHARFCAIRKLYRYQINPRPTRSPLVKRFTWHHPRPLNIQAMRQAAEHLIGEHDFSAFRASGCSAQTPHRQISRLEIIEVNGLITLEILGNAFLRNMVRIVVGTLSEVGAGRFSPNFVATALASQDRTQAGQTAPARGLTLVKVYYPSDPLP